MDHGMGRTVVRMENGQIITLSSNPVTNGG
jgi:hypothetical protein